MSFRPLGLAIASLLAAVPTAHAQAPGEGMGAPGMTPPQPVVASPCACESVMARRWSVAIAVGSLGLAPQDGSASSQQFSFGQLALRFRATPQIELEGTLFGGNQKLDDGSTGQLKIAGGLIAARYRFMAEERWNWWAMAGVGGATIARDGATQQELDAAHHPELALGVGLERRFRALALQAELRMVAVGDSTAGQLKPVPNVGIAAPAPSSSQSGGSLTVGLGYYF